MLASTRVSRVRRATSACIAGYMARSTAGSLCTKCLPYSRLLGMNHGGVIVYKLPFICRFPVLNLSCFACLVRIWNVVLLQQIRLRMVPGTSRAGRGHHSLFLGSMIPCATWLQGLENVYGSSACAHCCCDPKI